jgi:hypothetical protein
VPASRYRLLLEVPAAGLEGHIDPGIIRTFILETSSAAPSPAGKLRTADEANVTGLKHIAGI